MGGGNGREDANRKPRETTETILQKLKFSAHIFVCYASNKAAGAFLFHNLKKNESL